MSSKNLYLKRNLAVEPLYNQWYAWWYLVSPATAPLFVANLHMKVMQSFVSAPDIHVAALQNPALRGGPYINYGTDKAQAVSQLLERTRREQATTLQFAEAVAELEKTLAAIPPASSLEPVYKKIPDILQGYVELVYDGHSRPNIRFIEGLLYKSPHYKESSQSLSFRLLEGDSRPYVFSTPRLDGERSTLHVHRPFRHEALDALFAMRDTPGPVEPLREALGIDKDNAALFDTFFTEEAPRPRPPRYDGNGVRVRYFGHACVLLESRHVSVMTDPVISYEYSADVPRFTLQDLPERVDYVLITHGHADHLMLETLLAMRQRIGTIVVPRASGGTLVDPSLKLLLRNVGFRNVVELDDLETLELPGGGSLTGVPFIGEHGDLDIRAKVAHLVKLEGRQILMAADSNAIEPRLYDHVRAAVGPIDALFIGMESEGAPMSWMYGPLLPAPLPRKADQTRRLNGSNADRAIDIVRRLDPKKVFIYAMGREPWLGHVMSMGYTESSPQIIEARKLLAYCKDHNLVGEMPYLRGELFLE
jgi:L-ascorbate metabolism protein UlaG (beta-lactamase superfamily)